jgi:hypothetical protein
LSGSFLLKSRIKGIERRGRREKGGVDIL